MEISLSYVPGNPVPALTAALISHANALRSAMQALAELKGTDDLAWFDQLHQEAVRAAKGTVTEHIAIETEADAIRFGFETIDASFKSIRVGLVEEK